MCNPSENVIAVMNAGKVVSVGCGKYCFAVEDGTLVKDTNVENFYKHQNVEKLDQYNSAFELCQMAFENDMYDETQEK